MNQFIDWCNAHPTLVYVSAWVVCVVALGLIGALLWSVTP